MLTPGAGAEKSLSACVFQFSLIFKGPAERYLPQQIYALEHPALGTLHLFLVPVDRKKDGFLYEAYFNRAAPED